MKPPDVWLTSKELAERLKVPARTLDAWASARRGPRFARFGRYRRYLLSDVIDWEHEQLNRE